MRPLIKISGAVPCLAYARFVNPIDWTINEGENWAVIGPNGSGKSLLVNLLSDRYGLREGSVAVYDGSEISGIVRVVEFKDIYNFIDSDNSYYQNRWNKGDSPDVTIVSDIINPDDLERIKSLADDFGATDMLDKEINMLSSGELRKLLILRALLTRPRILILDNPFIGLDASSREQLNSFLDTFSHIEGLQVVLVLTNVRDIPAMITHVLPVSGMCLREPVTREEFLNDASLQAGLFDKTDRPVLFPKYEQDVPDEDFKYVARLKNVTVKYASRVILDGLDWEIIRGEKWALTGPNGAGKSTLLSLLYGDNPQAYANDITLFDRKRGSGESIWDIKKRIGYVSPEMHLYFMRNVRCMDVVASGFFDTIGLYRSCTTEQESMAQVWMEVFGISHLKDRTFLNISSGEQRLVLLARVFVKNPDLLILDEPLHGLDAGYCRRVKQIIEQYCTEEKSLIYVTHYRNEIPDVVTKEFALVRNV